MYGPITVCASVFNMLTNKPNYCICSRLIKTVSLLVYDAGRWRPRKMIIGGVQRASCLLRNQSMSDPWHVTTDHIGWVNHARSAPSSLLSVFSWVPLVSSKRSTNVQHNSDFVFLNEYYRKLIKMQYVSSFKKCCIAKNKLTFLDFLQLTCRQLHM